MDAGQVEEVSQTLAANLRAARGLRGWRLDDLAEASGVSRGMIHQIETARSNPSVATLTRLCSALDVPISQLVEMPTQLGSPARRADALVSRHGRSTAALLLADGRHELWEHTLHPGDAIHDAGHPAGTRELIHVTSGTLHVDVGGATFVVPALDALSMRGDRPHTYRNAGDQAIHYTLVVIYTGAHDARHPRITQ
ncbi:helix-turn-helix domain-containing protein [Microtetraspora malaysiensis]|uniref:helix-turn-helix domain-containing protein n=1 Tax=Microtetraspora malaysiensis TaxID=161358 RepID=UPI003D8C8EFC